MNRRGFFGRAAACCAAALGFKAKPRGFEGLGQADPRCEGLNYARVIQQWEPDYDLWAPRCIPLDAHLYDVIDLDKSEFSLVLVDRDVVEVDCVEGWARVFRYRQSKDGELTTEQFKEIETIYGRFGLRRPQYSCLS